MTHSVTVDIVSDLVCPWCWLGKRHWDEARKLTADIKVDTTWRPYQLDPTLAREGRPYKDYMREKFSGAEASGRWKAMRDHLEQAGPGVGIDFRFDDITMRPNTLNAHRLMRWAGGQDKTNAMAEALFSAFFNHTALCHRVFRINIPRKCYASRRVTGLTLGFLRCTPTCRRGSVPGEQLGQAATCLGLGST